MAQEPTRLLHGSMPDYEGLAQLFGVFKPWARAVGIVALCLAASSISSAALSLAQTQPPEETAVKQVQTCFESKAMPECMQGVLPTMVRTFGLAKSNDLVLEAVSRSGLDGIVACHAATEDLGRLWARERGVSALNDLVYSCLGGPMHGIFYTLGSTLPGPEMAALTKGLCEDFAVGKPWVVGWDCRHGVGHAVGLDRNLSAKEAFDLCADVYSTPTGQEDCAGGTIGSIIERISKGESVEGFDLADPLTWCRTTLTPPMSDACAARAPVVLYVTGVPTREIVKYCKPKDLDCSYGTGYVAGIAGLRLPAHLRMDTCRMFEGEESEACLSGVIRAITPDFRLMNVDPGVCAVAGDLADLCQEETERMNTRELTLAQIRDLSLPAYRGETDPAPWPRR